MLAPLWSEAQNNQNPNNLILQISFLIERESQTTVKKFHGAGHHFILFYFTFEPSALISKIFIIFIT